MLRREAALPGAEPTRGMRRGGTAVPDSSAAPAPAAGQPAQGLPRRATPLSPIPPANKSSIRDGPSRTAAKAGVRLSLREKMPFGAVLKKLPRLCREGVDPERCWPPQLPAREPWRRGGCCQTTAQEQRAQLVSPPPGRALGAGAAPATGAQWGLCPRGRPAAPARLGWPPTPRRFT